MGEIAAHLTQVIARSRKPTLGKSAVLILDFSETGGEVFSEMGGEFTLLGIAVADQLSQALSAQTGTLEILDRTEFRKTLTLQRIRSSTLKNRVAALCLADGAGAEVFVIGVLMAKNESAFLRLRVVRVRDGKEIGEISESISLSPEMMDLVGKPALGLPPIPESDPPLARPGRNDVDWPICTVCPAPNYGESARRKMLSAAVVLQVTVTADGRTENLVVVSGAPCGLTEQPIAEVKTWRLKPATGPDGKPVAVTTPIEIVFRVN